MKRPQFGLRLMFLMIALLGAIFGWQAAVNQKRTSERQIQQQRLESEIATLERLFRDVPSWQRIHGTRLVEAKNELKSLSH